MIVVKILTLLNTKTHTHTNPPTDIHLPPWTPSGLLFFLTAKTLVTSLDHSVGLFLLGQSSTFDEALHSMLNSHLNDTKELSGLEISPGYYPFPQFKKDLKNLQASFLNRSEMLKTLKCLLPTLSPHYL